MKKTSNLGILSILLGCYVAIIGVIILKRSVITHFGQHQVFVCREKWKRLFLFWSWLSLFTSWCWHQNFMWSNRESVSFQLVVGMLLNIRPLCRVVSRRYLHILISCFNPVTLESFRCCCWCCCSVWDHTVCSVWLWVAEPMDKPGNVVLTLTAISRTWTAAHSLHGQSSLISDTDCVCSTYLSNIMK